MLEYLGGLHIEHMQTSHHQELEEWRQRYQQSNVAREASIDSIARGMAELASASGAPASPSLKGIPVNVIGEADAAVPASTRRASIPAQPAFGVEPVEITEADMPKCTNCKTCYQDLSELFEKTRIMVGGSPKEVGRVIPGVLERIEITPDLVVRKNDMMQFAGSPKDINRIENNVRIALHILRIHQAVSHTRYDDFLKDHFILIIR